MNKPEGIPDLSDLLINSYNLKDPERTARACENVLLPITTGIQAIGKLMASAADADPDPTCATYRDAGFLLEFLADAQGAMHHILSNAQHDLRERLEQAREVTP